MDINEVQPGQLVRWNKAGSYPLGAYDRCRVVKVEPGNRHWLYGRPSPVYIMYGMGNAFKEWVSADELELLWTPWTPPA